MQTNLISGFLNTPQGQEADKILRSCVHCGFCTATCPTYQLLGDELDGPRGRIYQIKLALEGEEVTQHTQSHLDRCLTCLNCETTCPSGVQYHRLLDIGREYVEKRVPRSLGQRLLRWTLRQTLPYSRRIALLVGLGQWFKFVLPAKMAKKIPSRQRNIKIIESNHARKMLMLAGCAQPVMTPRTNQAAKSVLGQLGIELLEVPMATCCGALSHHLSATEEAKDFMRRNIDAWWPFIEEGAEAVIMTASGCGAMVKDYVVHLADDPNYAGKAERVSSLTRDLCEVISDDDMHKLSQGKGQEIVFHPPCTLQHAQQLTGKIESLLTTAGYKLLPFKDSHLCCGSAGSYSILQSKLANQLKHQKLQALEANQPTAIVTANIGCQLHLQTDANVPVSHWIELFVDE